jgi:hypothetical protein
MIVLCSVLWATCWRSDGFIGFLLFEFLAEWRLPVLPDPFITPVITSLGGKAEGGRFGISGSSKTSDIFFFIGTYAAEFVASVASVVAVVARAAAAAVSEADLAEFSRESAADLAEFSRESAADLAELSRESVFDLEELSLDSGALASGVPEIVVAAASAVALAIAATADRAATRSVPEDAGDALLTALAAVGFAVETSELDFT